MRLLLSLLLAAFVIVSFDAMAQEKPPVYGFNVKAKKDAAAGETGIVLFTTTVQGVKVQAILKRANGQTYDKKEAFKTDGSSAGQVPDVDLSEDHLIEITLDNPSGEKPKFAFFIGNEPGAKTNIAEVLDVDSAEVEFEGKAGTTYDLGKLFSGTAGAYTTWLPEIAVPLPPGTTIITAFANADE